MAGGFGRDERDMHQSQGQGGMNNNRGYQTGNVTTTTTTTTTTSTKNYKSFKKIQT